MAPPFLLGPPEQYRPSPSSHQTPATQPPTSLPKVPATEILAKAPTKPQLPTSLPKVPATETTKPSTTWPQILAKPRTRSLTLLPTLNPCLNIFFNVTLETENKTLTSYLEGAWEHDPLTTLKLICDLGFITCKGKPNKETFFAAIVWLHQNHAFSLSQNLETFARIGYFKDFPEMLYRVMKCEIEEKRKERKERKKRKSLHLYWAKAWTVNEAETVESMKKIENTKEKAKALRKLKNAKRAKRAIKIYYLYPQYRYLHNCVAAFFAKYLKSDLEFLKSGEIENVSMAAKWCPSIDSVNDKRTLIFEAIARQVFPRESDEYKDISDAHYAYRVRIRLQKQVLVPLRKALESVKKSDLITHKHKKIKKINMERDEESKYKNFIKLMFEDQTVGDGLLLPHQVIGSLNKKNNDELAELQWKKLVEEFSKEGKLSNCLAVCDLSEGRRGTNMVEIVVSMGLLISDLSEYPWKGKVFTFSDRPKLHKIEGENLRSKSEFIREMDCGENVDFGKIYDRILQVAGSGKVKDDNMLKRIFVFTNKDFEQASKNNWRADYREAWKSYRKRGFKTVPEIVYWNLEGSIALPVVINSPVDKHHRGVVVVSGYSKSLMIMFLKGNSDSSRPYLQVNTNEDDLNMMKFVPKPEDVMESAISRDDFKNLVVFD